MEKLDGSCEWGDRLRCAAPRLFTIINALWAAVGVLYAALYFVILVRIARQLRVRLYQYHRMQNLGLQILVRSPPPFQLRCHKRAPVLRSRDTISLLWTAR